MPYYNWRGITLTGDVKRGVLFARSSDHLDYLLVKRHVALLDHKPKRYLIQKSIKLSHKAEFFHQLATLIDSGVLIHDALAIVGDQLDHPPLQEIVHAIAVRVHEGVPFSNALEQYPLVFNDIMVQMIRAGEESGNISGALDGIYNHTVATQEFYSNLRAALMVPMITLTFFVVIVMIIFIAIMPHFISIISSFNKTLPPSTQWLLWVSDMLQGTMLITLVLGVTIISYGIWRLTRKGRTRIIRDRIIMKLPGIGTLLQNRFLSYTMQSLALLMEGGMPLVDALRIIAHAIPNKYMQQQIMFLEYEVMAGNMLSDAMARHPDSLFSQDVVAMVEVGQESGNFSPLLKRIGIQYHQRLTQRLESITMLLQPAIMIILGLLVALLMFAVYGPIFNMAHAV